MMHIFQNSDKGTKPFISCNEKNKKFSDIGLSHSKKTLKQLTSFFSILLYLILEQVNREFLKMKLLSEKQ